MLKKIWNKLFRRKNFRIQTFTYYLPSPPPRKTGYREKQFDKVFFNYINRGYEIISIQTQSNTTPNQSGMWIICTVRATNSEADLLDLESFSFDGIVDTEKKEESLPEGLYHL